MKCGLCGNPTKLLFTSWYCDCEDVPKNSSSEEIITCDGRKWRTTILNLGDKLPAWATRG